MNERTNLIYDDKGHVMDQKICSYCDAMFELRDLTRDHFVPLSKGGCSHPHNIVICCVKCNSKKGNMYPESWLKKIGKLRDQDLVTRLYPTRKCSDRLSTIDGVIEEFDNILKDFNAANFYAKHGEKPLEVYIEDVKEILEVHAKHLQRLKTI